MSKTTKKKKIVKVNRMSLEVLIAQMKKESKQINSQHYCVMLKRKEKLEAK